MEKKMQTAIHILRYIWGCIGILENNLETARIVCWGLRPTAGLGARLKVVALRA